MIKMMTQILQLKHDSESCRLFLSAAMSAYRPIHQSAMDYLGTNASAKIFLGKADVTTVFCG